MKKFLFGVISGLLLVRVSKSRAVRSFLRDYRRHFGDVLAEKMIKIMFANGMTEHELATVTDILERRLTKAS